MTETLRVLDVPWHIGHQYEMLKFPFVEWTWLMEYRRGVNPATRGDLKGLFRWIPYYEPGAYDLAILHLDQECIVPKELAYGKGSVYQQMNEVIRDIPKVVIMHGTPYCPEWFERKDIIQRIAEMIDGNRVVVNSHQAAAEWGFGKVIIHGMMPHEWYDLPKEPRVVTVLSPTGMAAYYDRPFLEEVRSELAQRDINHCHIGVDFIPQNWRQYRTFLGSSLIYFNPTFESPMPRARTEAMLSGCCVLTTPYHDADQFIETGVNGFLITRDAVAVADLIESLLHDPARTRQIGQRGRQTALARFDWSRYAAEWKLFLEELLPW